MFSKSSFLALAAFAATLGHAHMIMSKPTPYGKDTINNSPLGSDYPCKTRAGGYTISEMNELRAGVPQTLSFTGSAVHGGGSCQISITTDKEPTAASKFKVIHSIIGGCPGVSGPATFDYRIPPGFPNGEFTLAWTWFNKIGNREMYMNCAPIKVTDGAEDSSILDSLPDMFIANIPSTECKTLPGKDVMFPNPGGSVQIIDESNLQVDLPAACGAASGAPPAPQAPQAPAPSPPAVSPPAVSPPAASAPAGSGAGAAPGASSTSTVTTLITITANPSLRPTPPAPALSTGTSAPTVPAAPTTPPADTGAGCGTDGALVCNGPDQFGLCNHGKIVWQPVAPGTTCQGGKITKRDLTNIVPGRFRRSHVRHA